MRCDSQIRWSYGKSAWIGATAIPGLLLAPWAVSVQTVTLAAVLGFGTFLFGHTIGLHRAVIHRSFTMPRWLRNLLLWVFVLTGLGGPLSWMRAHNQRDHWQNRADAPAWFRYDHGIMRDAWWNLFTQHTAKGGDLEADDAADPWLNFLEQTWVLHNLAAFTLLWACLGWETLVVAGLLRVWLGIMLHWWVGYEAHARGEQRWHIPGASEVGRNRLWLGILSLGEGFHNNHHAFPQSARIGHRWYEVDAGWLMIRLLGWLGLAHDIKEPADVVCRAGHETSAASDCAGPLRSGQVGGTA